MAFDFDPVSCKLIPDEEDCGGCGWKCKCYECSEDANTSWNDCQCTCRFWVMACLAVLLVFFIVFYVAAVFRKVLLYVMSTGAVILAGGLSILSAVTDHCGWPAYLAITLVFAFPCAYSCIWQFNQAYEHASDRAIARANREGLVGKQSSAVVMVFPGGEIQLGVASVEKSSDEPTVKRESVWVTAGLTNTPDPGEIHDPEVRDELTNLDGGASQR